MANFADEELIKVTVNLYKADVEWIKARSKSANPQRWSELLRSMTRAQIDYMKEMAKEFTYD